MSKDRHVSQKRRKKGNKNEDVHHANASRKHEKLFTSVRSSGVGERGKGRKGNFWRGKHFSTRIGRYLGNITTL